MLLHIFLYVDYIYIFLVTIFYYSSLLCVVHFV
nr:MAG TPA: hypothetical protein [Caudoviricetes sp.]